MSNPVVVEVLRGDRVESVHRGAGAVVDADGRVALAFGDIDRPIYPRSAVKAIQALPLIESGAADRLGLDEAEIALACASHSGEPAHVALAKAMLAKSGRDAGALECGAHWPLEEKASRALARSGKSPSALHNNCSGKHAGFVCFACAEGSDPKGYVAPAHAVQRAVTAALADVMGVKLGPENRAVDGCSIPAYAIPLRALAFGFARFGTGQGLAPERARAAARLRAAVAAHPAVVAGQGRFDTEVMTLLGARVFTKTGAEGVFCAALPELGLGLAVKADDGA
jgi:L-asparaginase II